MVVHKTRTKVCIKSKWSLCPKEVFCGRQRIEYAVSVATILFNDGHTGLLNLFKELGLSVALFGQVRARN